MADGNNNRDEIYSKSVRAGKRTYFFDVKATRGNDLYLTITESKRKFGQDGKVFYEKHKLFLYKEDFDKFSDGLRESIEKIEELRETGKYVQDDGRSSNAPGSNHTPRKDDNEETSEFTDVDFDDLGDDDDDSNS